MADRDVLERIGTMFHTKVHPVDRAGRPIMYGITLKGLRAVLLMRDLLPVMGERRALAIEQCLAAYAPPDRALDFAAAERMRTRRADGLSISALARKFGVSRPTVRQVLERSIYGVPQPCPGGTLTQV